MKAEPERRLTLPVSSVSTEIHKLWHIYFATPTDLYNPQPE